MGIGTRSPGDKPLEYPPFFGPFPEISQPVQEFPGGTVFALVNDVGGDGDDEFGPIEAIGLGAEQGSEKGQFLKSGDA